MKNSPFSQISNSPDLTASRRRSTRVEFVTTVLLSGKDAAGTPFREFTQTANVNVHGCKIRTSYRIMVGMLVTLECPQAGTSAKGVCVRVWDAEPGVAGHEIAVQLIKPQNLWGIPDPPADWEIVTNTMVHGQKTANPRAAGPTSPGTPAVMGPPVPISRAPARLPPPVPMAPAPTTTVPAPAAVPARPTAVTPPTIEQRLPELERRSMQLMESVLGTLRTQAEEITRNRLEEFREQVNALLQDAEMRQRQSLLRSYEETTDSLTSLHADLMGQMALRNADMIRSAEEALRSRLQDPPDEPDPAPAPHPPVETPEE